VRSLESSGAFQKKKVFKIQKNRLQFENSKDFYGANSFEEAMAQFLFFNTSACVKYDESFKSSKADFTYYSLLLD